MDRIAEFAGVERHLDTPIKRYSTGMQARLSFATPSASPPTHMSFDEVLSVVDGHLRDKCAQELGRLNPTAGRSIFMTTIST